MDDLGVLPGAGSLLPRERFLRPFLLKRPRRVLLVAPAGYGKTVLATQLASSGRFARVWCLKVDGQDLAYESLLRAIVLSQSRAVQQSAESRLLLPDSRSMAEAGFTRIVEGECAEPLCLLIDDMATISAHSELDRISRLLDCACPQDCCLVVTSRLIERGIRTPAVSWVIESDELRFTQEEAECYLASGTQRLPAPADAAGLLQVCQGHPALFAVMATHWQLGDTPSPGAIGGRVQLREELAYLAASHLDEHQWQALAAASLMESGTVADLSSVLGRPVSVADLQKIAECIPLIRFCPETTAFTAHGICRSTFAYAELVMKDDSHQNLLRRVAEWLGRTESYGRLFETALEFPSVLDLPALLERHGSRVLAHGNLPLLRRALSALSVDLLVNRPELLLLSAEMENAAGDTVSALRKARLAAELLEYGESRRAWGVGRILLGRLLVSVGEASEGRNTLLSVLNDTQTVIEPDVRVVLLALLGVSSATLGDSERMAECFRRAREDMIGVSAKGTHLLDLYEAYSLCSLDGDYAGALERIAPRLSDLEMAADMRLRFLANAALAACFRGVLDRARALIVDALGLASACNARTWEEAMLGNRAAIAAAEGDYEAAETDLAACVSEGTPAGDADRFMNLSIRSAWRRASGELGGAFCDSEAAREFFRATEMVASCWTAESESAANMLALGDTYQARCRAESVLASAAGRSCVVALAARLTLSECHRQESMHRASVADLAPSADYLLSGNGNWITAMYIRAFPGLLGVVAAVVGAERVPAHMLRMILPDNADISLPMAREILPDDEWAILAKRLLGEQGREAEAEASAGCRVRLFGGLEVEVEGRRVADSGWRKRKARLLFAMLVVKKGRDVPREQLLEYLWPEMDAERAISNFYVVWNNMKNALCPDLPKGEALPYARTSGGVCRADDLLVTSDLDEFQRLLADIRGAEDAGDAQAAGKAAQRLSDIYRGDLLPGDIYDDWFAPLRERCRQEFGDAMLQAARMLEDGGDEVAALQIVRTALAHDAWREDLYQAALRCQIAVGQRSAAIDTYMACMHKLSEDLGLDPSVETRKLYERVLAMEDPAEEGYAV